MSYMSQQLMSAVRQLAETDFQALPAVQFLGKFRQAMIYKGLSVADAESIAAGMTIELAPGMFSDEELTELAQLYASMIVSVQAALTAEGFVDSIGVVLKMSSSFSLKCS
jgi:hypothetical protein